ncbi:MAG: RluA family pseudouridine synthase [Betaproteobacteria bacterium]
MSDRTWSVAEHEAGTRLDKYLSNADRLASRGRASEALARGKVFINGTEATPAQAGVRLATGDRVRVWMDRPGSSRRPVALGEAHDLAVLYEDDAIVVLNKPAGILSVPLERQGSARSVYDDLRKYLSRRGRRRPHVVHRIDRDTSGLVVFAKTALAQQQLKEQFRRHLPERVYLALVYGTPEPAEGTWQDRLVWDTRALIQKETHHRDPKGSDAICRYRVVERLGAASLVEVKLVTGKRNQIRLQARLRGHTLVGERRYVYGPEALRPIRFPRQALHAWRLAFGHPSDGRPLQFEAPLPGDMAELVERLRRT